MTLEEEKAWRMALKTGDEVCVGVRDKSRIVRVERVTPKQIAVAGFRFRRDDGHEVGGNSFYWASLRPVTDEIREEVETRRIVAELVSVPWGRQPLAVLRAVKAALSASEGKP